MKWIYQSLSLVVTTVFLASSVGAQTDIGLKGIGGHIGLVKPSGIGSVIGFGAIVGLGTIIPALHVEANIDYWSKSESESDIGGTGEGTFRDLSLSGTAKYVFPTNNPAFKPFASGGLGLHFYKAEAKAQATGFGSLSASATATRLGIDIGGGVAFAATPKIDLIGSLKYRIVSDVNQLFISVGAIFDLGK